MVSIVTTLSFAQPSGTVRGRISSTTASELTITGSTTQLTITTSTFAADTSDKYMLAGCSGVTIDTLGNYSIPSDGKTYWYVSLKPADNPVAIARGGGGSGSADCDCYGAAHRGKCAWVWSQISEYLIIFKLTCEEVDCYFHCTTSFGAYGGSGVILQAATLYFNGVLYQ